MAGIAGITGTDNKEWVRRALKAISHRGGSGKTVRTLQGATLGQVWPAAQDCVALGADQTTVVLDGEIHNWTDISVGGTCALEAVEQAYREKGPGFVSDLDGPFALAIAGADGLFLARDRVGQSPLYFGRRNGTLCFASEMKGILDWDGDIAEFPPGPHYTPDTALK